MEKGLRGYDLNNTKKEVESREVTNNTVVILANHSIEKSNSKRYNPRQLKDKRKLKNSLMIINALYKKGVINVETMANIEKKYGRLDG